MGAGAGAGVSAGGWGVGGSTWPPTCYPLMFLLVFGAEASNLCEYSSSHCARARSGLPSDYHDIRYSTYILQYLHHIITSIGGVVVSY